MDFYRKHFPGKVLPKHHFLEDHVIPWINHYGCGMGAHGEQAVESTHAQINKIIRDRAGTASKAQQLMTAVKAQHLHSDLSISDRIVSPKKRKKRKRRDSTACSP